MRLGTGALPWTALAILIGGLILILIVMVIMMVNMIGDNGYNYGKLQQKGGGSEFWMKSTKKALV